MGDQLFKPGQTVYLLYWRRPEDKKMDRCTIYLTERGRDNAMTDMLMWGMIVQKGTMVIPRPKRAAPDKSMVSQGNQGPQGGQT